jgi:hypothetical protein
MFFVKVGHLIELVHQLMAIDAKVVELVDLVDSVRQMMASQLKAVIREVEDPFLSLRTPKTLNLAQVEVNVAYVL